MQWRIAVSSIAPGFATAIAKPAAVTTYAFPDAFAAISYAACFAIGALVAMRRPAYAIALLIVVQPFAIYGDVWVTTLTLPKATLLGVLLGLFTHGGALRPFASPGPRAIFIAGAVLVTATLLTLAHATYAAPVARETLKAAEYVLLFVAIVSAYRLDPDKAIVRNACVSVAILVALLALSQEFYGATSSLRINGHQMPRIAGPIEGPNQLAGYFDVAIPLLFALAIDSPSLLIQTALFLIVLADVLTFSRGGALGATAGILAIALTYRRHILRPIAFMAAGLLAGIGAAGFLAHSLAIFRLWDFSDSPYAGGVGTRTELWHAAFALWRQHPIFGVGAGNFELEIPLTGLRGVRTHANSLYLQSLVEGGIPLFAATLWLAYVSVATFARDRLRSPFIVAAFAASIALGLHQVVDLLVFYPKVGGWWWIVLGLGAAQLAVPERVSEPACV
jgi:O-antigen ligase